MSRPVIPGYLEHQGDGALADLWIRPAGVPAPLWPTEIMRTVDSNPTDWVTVAEHFATGTERSGTSCILVQAADTSSALAGTTWIGGHLGQVAIVDDETFEDGLAVVTAASRWSSSPRSASRAARRHPYRRSATHSCGTGTPPRP